MISGGLLLAVLGMSFGLWYAVFAEHQQLEEVGKQLTTGFVSAAGRDNPASHAALNAYAGAHYDYVRYVDAHSHWSGLAVLAIVLGLAFPRIGFDERRRRILAAGFLAGAFLFPLGVILETLDHGSLPRALAVLGSVLVAGVLAIIAVGFLRGTSTDALQP